MLSFVSQATSAEHPDEAFLATITALHWDEQGTAARFSYFFRSLFLSVSLLLVLVLRLFSGRDHLAASPMRAHRSSRSPRSRPTTNASRNNKSAARAAAHHSSRGAVQEETEPALAWKQVHAGISFPTTIPAV
eukprot:COSAG05_NODE_7779_length_771_cov_0.688988_1_plen_132_part_01